MGPRMKKESSKSLSMRHEELKRVLSEASQVFVLTDENVAAFWLPELEHWLGCEHAVEIVVKVGERYKTLQTAQKIWKVLMKHQADRQAILVNLGGGMVTDLGGFVASCYQRGIRFVHVPTTLLGMVDAAIGGKTGVDFLGCKNQLGTFVQPLDVLVHPVFLSTLPDRELLSGLAEMVKYGFIADPKMLHVTQYNYEQYLLRAGRIKNEIVAQDFKEQGYRKVLNFGHTIGHAVESWLLQTDHPLTHGESVAVGMWCALWLSVRQCDLQEKVLGNYEPTMRMLLSEATGFFTQEEIPEVMRFLAYDKKNQAGAPRFVLLEGLADPCLDQEVPEALVRQSLEAVIGIL